jgi:hypothetical protein
VEGIRSLQTLPADVISPAGKGFAATAAERGSDIGNGCKAVIAKKRQFPTGKLPRALETISRKEEFLTRLHKESYLPRFINFIMWEYRHFPFSE